MTAHPCNSDNVKLSHTGHQKTTERGVLAAESVAGPGVYVEKKLKRQWKEEEKCADFCMAMQRTASNTPQKHMWSTAQNIQYPVTNNQGNLEMCVQL